MSTEASSKICSAWANRAEDLANWAMARLVNRLDAWGAYRSDDKSGQYTVKGKLTPSVLVRHFRAQDRSTIIGLHTASADNMSKGGTIDIDYHGPGGTSPVVNRVAAMAWHDALVAKNFNPLLTDSNEQGGYHLDLLLAEAVPADRLFYFFRTLTANHASLGLASPPEQFPKQADVRNCKKGLGNWLRLPGRHHKRAFWSRVWDGREWLDGDEAIDFMLALGGDPPSLIPEDIEWQFRIGAYMATMPNLGEGQGRDDVAFKFLAFMVRDLKLSDPYALTWAERWDAGNSPPKGPDRLREILGNVHTYGQRPYGAGLAKSRVSEASEASEVSEVSEVSERSRPIRRLPPYKPFPVDTLPEVLKKYVVASAEAIGCDVSLVALPALATIAGAIGNARALVLKKRWNEPAVIWSLSVVESGGLKSPAYNAATQPLMDLQWDEIERHQEQMVAYDNAKAEWATRKKEERGDEPKKPGKAPNFIAGDTTIEVVGEILRESPKGLLIARDELDTWFGSFVRYKGKSGGSDRACWLELHQANTLRVDRIGRERLIVPRACASITGTIQPVVLARAFDPAAMESGLGPRFLLAMPPKIKRIWSDKEVEQHVTDEYTELLRRLLALELADKKKRRPKFLGLSVGAQLLWRNFFNEWGEIQFNAEGEQASAFAKIEAYAARLALIHHVVEQAVKEDRTSVGENSMKAGIELARWFANELTRVYCMLREKDEDRAARRLVEWVRSHGKNVPGRPNVRGVTVRQLQKSNASRWPAREVAEAALADLASRGLGEWMDAIGLPAKGHHPRWFVLLAQTLDTSDTQDDEDDEEDDSTSDAHSDTQHETNGQAENESSGIPY